MVERPSTVNANMLDTSVGDPDEGNKRDPALVAKGGLNVMNKGEASNFSGFTTGVKAVLANVTPASVLAEQHRKIAEPGSASS